MPTHPRHFNDVKLSSCFELLRSGDAIAPTSQPYFHVRQHPRLLSIAEPRTFQPSFSPSLLELQHEHFGVTPTVWLLDVYISY